MSTGQGGVGASTGKNAHVDCALCHLARPSRRADVALDVAEPSALGEIALELRGVEAPVPADRTNAGDHARVCPDLDRARRNTEERCRLPRAQHPGHVVKGTPEHRLRTARRWHGRSCGTLRHLRHVVPYSLLSISLREEI